MGYGSSLEGQLQFLESGSAVGDGCWNIPKELLELPIVSKLPAWLGKDPSSSDPTFPNTLERAPNPGGAGCFQGWSFPINSAWDSGQVEIPRRVCRILWSREWWSWIYVGMVHAGSLDLPCLQSLSNSPGAASSSSTGSKSMDSAAAIPTDHPHPTAGIDTFSRAFPELSHTI